MIDNYDTKELFLASLNSGKRTILPLDDYYFVYFDIDFSCSVRRGKLKKIDKSFDPYQFIGLNSDDLKQLKAEKFGSFINAILALSRETSGRWLYFELSELTTIELPEQYERIFTV